MCTGHFVDCFHVVARLQAIQATLIHIYVGQHSRIWHLLHRRAVKSQTSLRMRTVSPEPTLHVDTKYGSRGRLRPNSSPLASLDTSVGFIVCICDKCCCLVKL